MSWHYPNIGKTKQKIKNRKKAREGKRREGKGREGEESREEGGRREEGKRDEERERGGGKKTDNNFALSLRSSMVHYF